MDDYWERYCILAHYKLNLKLLQEIDGSQSCKILFLYDDQFYCSRVILESYCSCKKYEKTNRQTKKKIMGYYCCEMDWLRIYFVSMYVV